MYTIDFETEAIEQGSCKTPKPVGLAIKHNDKKGKYISWAHLNIDNSLQENTHSFSNAQDELNKIFSSDEDILCHNAKFDMRICVEWFKLEYPPAHKVHDTMILAFINDPREPTLKLKSLADKYLDMPPQEQQDLKEWIIHNVSAATDSTWGAYICYGPIKMSSPYAIGDVDRTYKLFKFLQKNIKT